ncbi:RNA polymerase sigma factor [Patescibacteria group bacterium]|nr:RNA polymerase sigma factor [Patescibacteria group bacterium]
MALDGGIERLNTSAPFTYEAFVALVQQEARALHAFALSLTKNLAGADDLIQETLESALKKWRTFDSSLTMGPWLKGIMRNRFIDSYRRVLVRKEIPLSDVHEAFLGATSALAQFNAPSKSEEQKITITNAHTLARELLATLPEEQRRVVLMEQDADMTNEDIAYVLNIPLGTVKSRLRLAKEKLQRELVKRGITVETLFVT